MRVRKYLQTVLVCSVIGLMVGGCGRPSSPSKAILGLWESHGGERIYVTRDSLFQCYASRFRGWRGSLYTTETETKSWIRIELEIRGLLSASKVHIVEFSEDRKRIRVQRERLGYGEFVLEEEYTFIQRDAPDDMRR